jgi:hypothetical protein
MVLSYATVADDNVIATIIAAKGDIKAKLATGEIIEVNTTSGLTEGTFIKTGSASFVKIVFIDKSYMTLGPDSLVKISKFTKKDAGVISLVRGQIRSQVTKDYMELEDKNKSKLFVRTKSAAMGIRGTDFQVDYTKEDDKTTLLTFEGKVVMNKIDEKFRDRELSQKDLDQLLEKKERVEVTKGQLSDVRSEAKHIERPRTVEVAILDKLKKQDFPKEILIEKRADQIPALDDKPSLEKKEETKREMPRSTIEDKKEGSDFEDIIKRPDSPEKKEVEIKEEIRKKVVDKKEKFQEKKERAKERLEHKKEEMKERIEERKEDIKEEVKEGTILAPKI